jgi:hypothetical protein
MNQKTNKVVGPQWSYFEDLPYGHEARLLSDLLGSRSTLCVHQRSLEDVCPDCDAEWLEDPPGSVVSP